MKKIIFAIGLLLPMLVHAASFTTPPFPITEQWDAVKNGGLDPTGSVDVTAKLISFIQSEKENLYVPDGDYLIASAGDDAGGAYATITKSVIFNCGPRVRFFTNAPGLDNDMIRFSVPTNGAGLPAEGIDLTIRNCKFDQTNQKNSTVGPFHDIYPPVNQGTSITTDGLSIHGSYNDGVGKSGFRTVTLENIVTYGGPNWETSGGDSGVFVYGTKNLIVTGSTFEGNRDVGLYVSTDATGVAPTQSLVQGNRFLSNFHGVDFKRAVNTAAVLDNYFYNNVRSVLTEHIIGTANTSIEVAHNYIDSSNIPVRLIATNGAWVHDNYITNGGATLADGTTIEYAGGFWGVLLQGSNFVTVKDNKAFGVKAAVATTYPGTREFLKLEVETYMAVDYPSTNNWLENNYSSGWRTAGADLTGSNNSFIRNFEAVGTANVNLSGSTNSQEVRLDAANKAAISTPMYFRDGTSSLPIMSRIGNENTGIYFGTNVVGVSAGGQANHTSNINYFELLRGLVTKTRTSTTVSATVAATDINVCINKAVGSATAVSLPASPVTGQEHTVSDCKGDANTNNITITPNAGNIDGAPTYVINTAYGSWSGYYTGTIWKTTAAR